MTGNELYEEYCNEYPLIMGYREVSYESWLERQVLELRENVVNKNCNLPHVSNNEVAVCEKRYNMNTLNELLIKLKNNEITCDEALSQLSGFCPSIISNDNGQWAVVFDGVQFSAVSEFPEDVIASYYIDKKYWKPTVREALVFAISVEYFGSSLDLSKLEQKIDDALKNETKESLTDWINKNRE